MQKQKQQTAGARTQKSEHEYSARRVVAGLATGKLSLEMSEWGDGMRGVGIYHIGNGVPIERIAVSRWHVDQDEGLQYADRKLAPNWFWRVFNAGALTNQAREMLADHCRDNEELIERYCIGEETEDLPPLAIIQFEGATAGA